MLCAGSAYTGSDKGFGRRQGLCFTTVIFTEIRQFDVCVEPDFKEALSVDGLRSLDVSCDCGDCGDCGDSEMFAVDCSGDDSCICSDLRTSQAIYISIPVHIN